MTVAFSIDLKKCDVTCTLLEADSIQNSDNATETGATIFIAVVIPKGAMRTAANA